MGLAKLDDAEYARRARERNNRVNAAHRQRLLEAGKAQTNVWLPATLRAQLDATAALRNQNLSEVITALLTAALDPTTRPVDNFPLDAPAGVDPVGDDRRARIRALKREQPDLSNYAIAEQVGCSEPTVRRALKAIRLEAPA